MTRWEIAALALVALVFGLMVGATLQRAAGPSRPYTNADVCALALVVEPLRGEGDGVDSWRAQVARRCSDPIPDPRPGSKDALG